ncbi:MAG: AraC family transcriptional regulator [Reyranella sp.]|uniref:AraC family transcriptional regulator n=1 Tax=Reyranella sp. TaxID=1929291 RepID=UPI0011F5D944|nr:AraC family transcriptional regulator [Reyranella sp.]TAJ97445.1 MAG: AraC family transcriptional regulator [Reyranella sp.]
MTVLATSDELGPPARRSDSAARTMRVGPMFGLEALLGRFGVPLAPLIGEAGLPPDCFGHPDNRWPVDRLLDLVARCGEAANCPHLGLLLAQPVGPAALGAPLARLLGGALTVERALRGLTMNLHLNGEALVPALSVGPDGACFSITPYAWHRRGTLHLEDFSLAAAINILRFLGGPQWTPLRVTFAHRELADRRPYDDFFKAPLVFDAPQSAVYFDPCWLPRRPVSTPPGPAGPPSPPAAGEDLDIAVRARRAVIGAMAQGIVGVDAVSSATGLSRRTLNRRLAERGTSIRDLIAEVRLQVAQQLLRDTDLTVADIAVTTCYSDVAAFSRAFSVRAGQSPAAWRSARA